MRSPVACHIITGTLGVGKTTFITKLIASKPSAEKWAIVVNEFGALGIDGALITAAANSSTHAPSVVVRELPGGCLCCTVSGLLPVALAQLIRQAKPDRLIIEPSGLGHPAGLLQSLQQGHLAPSLSIQAVICLVDVAKAGIDFQSQTYEDQINVADVIIGSKADLASSEQLQAFSTWANELWPPKAKVYSSTDDALTEHNQLLDTPRAPVYTPLVSSTFNTKRFGRRQQQHDITAQPNQQGSYNHEQDQNVEQQLAGLHIASSLNEPEQTSSGNEVEPQIPINSIEPSKQSIQIPIPIPGRTSTAIAIPRPGRAGSGSVVAERHEDAVSDEASQAAADMPMPGQPVQYRSQSSPEHMAFGWLFHPDDIFNKDALLDALLNLQARALRLKGVFRVSNKSWVSANWVNGLQDKELHPTAYIQDSRIELIVSVSGIQPVQDNGREPQEAPLHQSGSWTCPRGWTALWINQAFRSCTPIRNNMQALNGMLGMPAGLPNCMALPAAPSSSSPNTASLFVKGLAKGVTERHLKAIFSAFGGVADIQVARHRSGRSAGFAVVTFASRDEAQRAFAVMDNAVLANRRLTVRWYSNELQQQAAFGSTAGDINMASAIAAMLSLKQLPPAPQQVGQPSLSDISAQILMQQLLAGTQPANDINLQSIWGAAQVNNSAANTCSQLPTQSFHVVNASTPIGLLGVPACNTGVTSQLFPPQAETAKILHRRTVDALPWSGLRRQTAEQTVRSSVEGSGLNLGSNISTVEPSIQLRAGLTNSGRLPTPFEQSEDGSTFSLSAANTRRNITIGTRVSDTAGSDCSDERDSLNSGTLRLPVSLDSDSLFDHPPAATTRATHTGELSKNTPLVPALPTLKHSLSSVSSTYGTNAGRLAASLSGTDMGTNLVAAFRLSSLDENTAATLPSMPKPNVNLPDATQHANMEAAIRQAQQADQMIAQLTMMRSQALLAYQAAAVQQQQQPAFRQPVAQVAMQVPKPAAATNQELGALLRAAGLSEAGFNLNSLGNLAAGGMA